RALEPLRRQTAVPTTPPDRSATASRNVRTEYGYDGSGRRIWTKGPTGEVARTTYEPRGLVDRVVAGCYTAGAYSTSTCDPFDAAGRQNDAIANYVDGNPATGSADSDRVTHTEYDAAGRATARTANYVDGAWDPARPDEDNKTVTVYDALDRPMKLIEHYVDGV